MKPWYAGRSTTPWCVSQANRHARRSQRRRLRQQRGLVNLRWFFHAADKWA